MTIIGIGSDHRGVQLKTNLVAYLENLSVAVKDFGCFDQDSVDYPDYAKLVTDAIEGGLIDIGILICGSGIGMSIAANRNSKIRAVLCFNSKYAELARAHNDANLLVLGSDFITLQEARKCIDVFLATEFAGGRHQTRINKLSN